MLLIKGRREYSYATRGARRIDRRLIHQSAWKRNSANFAVRGSSTPGSPTLLAEGWLWGPRADAPPSRCPLRVEGPS
jgi:hypothetical protein